MRKPEPIDLIEAKEICRSRGLTILPQDFSIGYNVCIDHFRLYEKQTTIPQSDVGANRSCESCVHFVLRDFGFAGCDNDGICQHKDRFQPKDTRL